MQKTSNELSIAIEAAHIGARTVSGYFRKRSTGNLNVESKSENHELVTQADIESEQAIINHIKHAFPNHDFLAEESAGGDVDSENLWIIDPLDGTNNFAHGVPHFAISIAYHRNGVAQCGAILNPITLELFTCEKGQGAWSQAREAPARVSTVNKHEQLNQTMIAVGFYYDRGEMMRDTLATIEKLFEQKIHGIRRMGTAALDLVQVGLGRFGGYFEYTLSPWDYAAARLFVEEAGGTVTNCDGTELGLEKSSILASNGLLHDQMLNIVRRG